MKKIFTTLLFAAAFIPAFAVKHTVNVSDYQYSPANLTINLGDTVVFQRIDGSHPTESATGAFATFQMNAANPTHQVVLSSTGVFPYYCVPHQHMGMVGSITVNQVMSTPALAKTADVLVYPNPANDVVNVSYNIAGVDGIKITNMIGQQVRYVRPELGSNSSVRVSLAELPKGMYLVNVQVKGTTVFTRRLIKTR